MTNRELTNMSACLGIAAGLFVLILISLSALLLSGCDTGDTVTDIVEVIDVPCFPPGLCGEEEGPLEEVRSGFGLENPPERVIRGQ